MTIDDIPEIVILQFSQLNANFSFVSGLPGEPQFNACVFSEIVDLVCLLPLTSLLLKGFSEAFNAAK